MSRPDRAPPTPGPLQAQVMRLLRPLVRLLIRSGVPFPAFVDLVRRSYVEVADADFRLDGKEQTDSRITLLTGVHRKEVRRLRSEGPAPHAIPPDLSLTSQILARWLGGPAYTDAGGRPLPLRRLGPEPSFDALVSSVTKDMRARAILDEWLDRGIVALDAEDRVTLDPDAMLPKPGDDNQLYYFGRNLHDHIAAAAANVGGDARMFFDRSVHYDGLTAAAAQDLENLSRRLAMEVLQNANAEAQKSVTDAAPGHCRWNFGVYIYVEPEEPDASAPEERP